MINNLRYHLDGNRILVRWNYVDIEPTVTVTCKLCKRINGERIAQTDGRNHDAITLPIYRSNGGGDWFEMPDCPAKVIVYENQAPDATRQEIDIQESPRYFIRAGVRVFNHDEPGVAGGFLKRGRPPVPHRYAAFRLAFPDTLTDADMKSVEGWVVSGVKQDANGQSRFFWPATFHAGENLVEDFEIPNTPDMQADAFHFEVVPEVEGTRYANMFTFSQQEQSFTPRTAAISEVDLARLKRRDPRTGLYEITCPFCLKHFTGNGLFRADVFQDNTGYAGEPDPVYAAFYSEVGSHADMSANNLGKVLDWAANVTACATAENPADFIVYDHAAPPKGVIVAVRDDRGNVTANKICPYCHHSIPPYSGFYPSVFINLMGNTGSGKTIFMSRLVQLLFHRALLPGYSLTCEANNNQASQEYQRRFDILSGEIRPSEQPAAPQGQFPGDKAGAVPGGIPGMGFAPPAFGMKAPGAAPAAPAFGAAAPASPAFGAATPASPAFGGYQASPAFGGAAPASPAFGGQTQSFSGDDVTTASAEGKRADTPLDGGAPISIGFGDNDAIVLGGMPGFSGESAQATSPVATGNPISGAAQAASGFGGAPARAAQAASPLPAFGAGFAVPGTPKPAGGALPSYNDLKSGLSKSAQANKAATPKDTQKVMNATSVGYLEPCVYQLRTSDRSRGLILSIFDFPGEFIWTANNRKDAYFSYIMRLLNEIDGMVFLFDPMTIKCVENLGHDAQLEFSRLTYEAQESKKEQILRQRPIDIIETFKRNFFPVAQVPFPVVYTVSKSDAIRDYLAAGQQQLADRRFLDESRNGAFSGRKGVDLAELEANSSAILAFMDDDDLRTRCDAAADDFIWMCVSALGIAPQEGSMKGRYGNPVRVMDPLEWLLYQLQLRCDRQPEPSMGDSGNRPGEPRPIGLSPDETDPRMG